MVMKLVKTFKDKHRFYMLTEYVDGEDFVLGLKYLGVLPEKTAKFYTACLILILDYLRSKKVVYRDLKPENIVIDFEGYPKLIDFGTAKIIRGKTNTTVGTPFYMAPEVIKGSGYDFSADL